MYILLALFFYRETKGLSLEESALVYDFSKRTARALLAEVFRSDAEDKPETKHVEMVEMDEKPVCRVEGQIREMSAR